MVETGRSPTHGKTRREKAPGGFVRANVFRLAFHVMFVRRVSRCGRKTKNSGGKQEDGKRLAAALVAASWRGPS